MSERSDLQRLRDAREYARRANFLIGGMSLEMIKEIEYYDHATRSYLTIVGEALTHVSDTLKASHQAVPWKAVRAF